MSCEKCGRPTEEGKTLCNECAANKPAEETPKKEAPAFTVNTKQEAPAKKKGLLGWILGGVALVVAIVVAIIMLGGNGGEKPGEVPQEPQSLTDTVVNVAGEAYGAFLESLKAPAGATKHTVSVTAGEELTALLETFLASQDMDAELSWFKKLTLQFAGANNETAAGLDVGLGLNDKNVLSLKAFLDLAEENLYLTIPGVNETALKIPAKVESSSAVDPAALSGLVDMPQEMAASLVKDLPDRQTFEAALRVFIALIVDGVKDGQKEQQTITVGEQTKQVTVTNWQLGEQDVINLAVAVLEKAQSDATVKQFVTAFCNCLNDYASSLVDQLGITVNVMKPEMILEQIPKLVEELKATEVSDAKITIALYTDEKNNLCGGFIKDTEGENLIDYRKIVSGDKTIMELVLPEEVVLKGEATAASTRIDVQVKAEPMITVYLEKADDASILRIVPGTALLEELSKEIPALGMAGSAAPELRLTGKVGNASLELWLNGKLFLSLGFVSEAGEAYTPVKPENAASVENALSLMGWVTKLKFDSVTQALKDAGVPQDYTDGLLGLIGEVAGLGSLIPGAA